jgi:hypothetical protein
MVKWWDGEMVKWWNRYLHGAAHLPLSRSTWRMYSDDAMVSLKWIGLKRKKINII